jgi:hypothetical protein
VERGGREPAVGSVGSRCSVVRFEKRARECICSTSLTRFARGRRRETDTTAASFEVRVAVFKRGESSGCDPKPDDLRLDKVKRAERHVEAC